MAARVAVFVVAGVLAQGCIALRYADYKRPGLRFVTAHNAPLPGPGDQAVLAAVASWRAAPADACFPTPYHRYVKTPAIGTFEGEDVVGVAFSGGGTRGVLFGAACVALLQQEWPALAGDAGAFLDAVDYVSGVSTGAVPAALLALERGDAGPAQLRVAHWPEALNLPLDGAAARVFLRRPDYIPRGLVHDFDTAPALTAVLGAAYFEGNGFTPTSGLRFGDLPSTPVLLIGAALLSDPASPFVFSRLPYRHAAVEVPELPWSATVQSFESFHSDIMAYPIAEACYASMSYPGFMRATLVRMRPPVDWPYAGMDGPGAEAMRAAFNVEGYAGTYSLKDGGLVDNRGVDLVHRLFARLPERSGRPPLLLSLDAGYLQVRPVSGGRTGWPWQSWFGEWVETAGVSFQTAQEAVRGLAPQRAKAAGYRLVPIRYDAWTGYFGDGEAGLPPEARTVLETMCAAEPLVGTPEGLRDIAREIGTGYAELPERHVAAIRVAARFAVEQALPSIRAWAVWDP